MLVGEMQLRLNNAQWRREKGELPRGSRASESWFVSLLKLGIWQVSVGKRMGVFLFSGKKLDLCGKDS